MNLVIDIGNSQTKVGWFDQGEMVESLRLTGKALHHYRELLDKWPVDKAIISSVGKDYAILSPEWEKNLVQLIHLDHTTALPFKILYETPETLGRDRIAACAGACFLYPGNDALIMDLGTAITIDFINAAGEYLGGNISPGMHARFRALHDYTARLPLLESDPNCPRFGKDTRTAIIAGVQQGIIFELNGYMEEFTERYPHSVFILTGGDALFFARACKTTVSLRPDLVMTGLNHILEFNAAGGKL